MVLYASASEKLLQVDLRKGESDMKVLNMQGRTGKPVANQFIIHDEDGIYFQSYKTVVAFIPDGEDGHIILDRNWDYSVTTTKYLNRFLGHDKQETMRRIKTGDYLVMDLNDGEP